MCWLHRGLNTQLANKNTLQCLYQDLVLCRVAGSSNDWLDKTELYKTSPRGMTRASVIHVPQVCRS